MGVNKYFYVREEGVVRVDDGCGMGEWIWVWI
jgi:hypothetical protein